MGNESATVDSAKRQRFYVTLLAFLVLAVGVGGYVDYWWRVVRERGALFDEICAAGGSEWLPVGPVTTTSIPVAANSPDDSPPFPSALRTWLGDRRYFSLKLPKPSDSEMVRRAVALFPEATVTEYTKDGGMVEHDPR